MDMNSITAGLQILGLIFRPLGFLVFGVAAGWLAWRR